MFSSRRWELFRFRTRVLTTTGNAGPGTDEKNHKVGEIFIACATKSRCTVQKLELSGSRPENREEACTAALELLIECIS